MRTDILVIGAGPAGLAAAISAADSGKKVIVLDDNPSAGGQIWRAGAEGTPAFQGRRWLQRFDLRPVALLTNATVISANAQARTVAVESLEGAREFEYQSLVLATGARELFLPFPGWTLPGVMGAGGLQAMVKGGMPAAGKSVVIAGSGPLLLAVAAYLRHRGARVRVIAEQASGRAVNRFAAGLWRYPRKALQGAALRSALLGTPYRFGCWIERAEGTTRLERVTLRQGSRVWKEPCDLAGIGYGLIPNTEVAALLGCTIEEGQIRVDDRQRTSVENVFCAGECTGIGGVDAAILEGQIAGFAAAGQVDRADRLLSRRKPIRKFAECLNAAFALRPELKQLPQPDTIVCRCEDVSYGKLRTLHSFREAKLHTRCGMGPCQGRVCGAASRFLLGWKPDSVRPPLFPAKISSLIQTPKALEETLSK